MQRSISGKKINEMISALKEIIANWGDPIKTDKATK